MLKVSLKGLWAHKRRLFGTVFAVLLGVTFLVGTLVLGDTMRAGFDDLFTTVNEGTDAVVRSATKVGSDQTETRGLIDTSLVEHDQGRRRCARRGRRRSSGFGQIVGKNGNPIGGNGPPTIAASWTDDPEAQPVERRRGQRAGGRRARSRSTRRSPTTRTSTSATRSPCSRPTRPR